MLTALLNKLQPQIELVGLDIGSASVKLIQLQRDKDGYTATTAAREDIEPASEQEPEQIQKNVVEAVRKCIRKTKLSSHSIVCGVSGPEVMIRGFKFPPLPDQAIDQAVRFEVQQVCPFENKEMILDYQLVENHDITAGDENSKVLPRNGLMVACTESAVKSKSDILADVGIRPMLVDADALAMLNCVNELDILGSDNVTAAVIDVGWETTNVVIYGQNGLPFVRDLSKAGRHIAQRIAGELDWPVEKVCHILTDPQADAEACSEILLSLNNAVRPLALAVNETLRFYSYQEKTSGVEQILLCGGFSLLDTFTEIFSDALPVEVRLLNPFDKIKCRAGEQGNELLTAFGPGMVVATGLAMRRV